MSYSSKVDNDLKCVIYKHMGIIQKEEMGKAWGKLLNIKEFTECKYNLLADMRGGSFEFSLDEVDEIYNFLVSIKNIIADKKMAVIVDNPYNTVVSMLFENNHYEKIGFLTKTFSTENAAMQWLKE